MLHLTVDWRGLTDRLNAGELLSPYEVQPVFAALFEGRAEPAQAIAFLSALHRRGESLVEIMAALRAARAAQSPCPVFGDEAMDTCGTGGDGSGTFNVSTAVALCAAASGLTVVKHGNRAATSKSGSADVLEALGVPVATDAMQVEQQVARHRFAFAFAPAFHPGFKHVAPLRREIPHRTIFNLLGPLLNPARVKRQVIGVFSPSWVTAMGETLRELGHVRALVVHGGGTDELSGWGDQIAAELGGQALVPRQPLVTLNVEDVRGGSAVENALIIRDLLAGKGSDAATDLVGVNLAAAWWVAGKIANVPAGLPDAIQFIRGGDGGRFLASITTSP